MVERYNDVPSKRIIIVGGGAVGLFLGLRLHQLQLPFSIFERRPSPRRHSRAIGIHPPSLALLDQLGVLSDLVAAGVQVESGMAVGDNGPLGQLSFASVKNHPYVLVSPQNRTESILEKHLLQRAPHSLMRNCEVTSVDRDGRLSISTEDGSTKQLQAALVIGCDGKHSLVRRAVGIDFPGRPYPHTFLMGDFDDYTGLGKQAMLFLTRLGLVESFPLPQSCRRWVASTGEHMVEAPEELSSDQQQAWLIDHLRGLISERTPYSLAHSQNHIISPFGVQHYLATSWASGRCVLAGDAAHVISPIGGQGMNLGWADAWQLGDVLARSIDLDDKARLFAAYTRRRRTSALIATRRAERNMRLGLPGKFIRLRNLLIRLLLRSPLEAKLAKIFTMHGV